MPFWCRLGWHSWRYDTYSDAAGTSDYRECRRCGKFVWVVWLPLWSKFR